MKGAARGASLRSVKRFPRGEQLDRIVAAALIVLGQIELWVSDALPGPKAVACPVMLVMTASVAFRRRWPLGAGSAALLANGVLGIVAGYGTSLANGVAWMCALYAIAVWTDKRRFLAGIGVLVASNVVPFLAHGATGINDVAIFTWVPILAMVLVRGAVRGREMRAEALAARAELLEREHELRAHEAVAEERARIARELHDVVTHNVSVMVIQAGAARKVLTASPEQAREALLSVEASGRAAMTELRHVMGLLAPGGETPELEPQPGLAELEALVGRVRDAGLPVSLVVTGRPDPALPDGVDLAGYRVVQEALTNAVKHAPGSSVTIGLRIEDGAVVVTVVNDAGGRPGAPEGAGQGLIGMRQRAELYGGSLRTGPTPDGGFAVTATFLLDDVQAPALPQR
jgi:signal transduction histidine kinase